jgi:thioredoxin-like negative regulator of GroEL
MATSYKSRMSSRSSLKSAKTSESSESSNGIWLVLGLLVILIIIVIIVGGFYKSFEKFTNSNPEKFTLYYFFMDGCSHCVDFKPTWEKIIAEIKPNYPNATFSQINIKESEIATQFKVNGVPSIILVDSSNKRNDYNGDRTFDDIKKFIEDKTKST